MKSVVFALMLFHALAAMATQPSLQRPFRKAETKEFRQKLKDVVPAIENLMGIGGTAGMSIGVMSHGEVVLVQSLGFADVERQLRADASTRYPLASLTKAFFAATVSQLVDEGLLQWDQPLNTYIPELAFDSDPTLASRLTLIDLLSHQTGLLRLDALWLGANGQVFIPKNYTVTLCNHLTSVYPLRSKWSYNNWMYALAGEIVERVTRLSWGHVLQLKVLGKLGLSQTTAIKSEITVNSTALPYMIMDDKTPVGVPDMALLDGDLMSSAGGVRSRVNDMLAWGNALLSTYRTNDRQLRGIEPILSGHAFVNKSIGSDELYAMGFAKVTTPTQFGKIGFNPSLVEEMPVLGDKFKPTQAFYHSGGGPGYNHCFMLVPEYQTVIIVLTNSISHGDIADWAAQTLFQAAVDIAVPVDLRSLAAQAAAKWRTTYQQMADTLANQRTPKTSQPALEDLVGTFYHKTQALNIRVFLADGQLRFNLNGRLDQEHTLSHYYDTFIFLPTAEDRIRRGLFHYDTQAWLLHFKRDHKDKITHIEWNLDPQSSAGEVFMKE